VLIGLLGLVVGMAALRVLRYASISMGIELHQYSDRVSAGTADRHRR
jgi:hypothetical protein